MTHFSDEPDWHGQPDARAPRDRAGIALACFALCVMIVAIAAAFDFLPLISG